MANNWIGRVIQNYLVQNIDGFPVIVYRHHEPTETAK
jgi:hypothetical protein